MRAGPTPAIKRERVLSQWALLGLFGVYMRFFFAALIAVFVSGATDGVRAAGDDVFVVARVPVQAEADTATKAKNLAQDRGRRRAMDILLRRITPEEEWSYLPTLAYHQESQLLSVDGDAVTGDGGVASNYSLGAPNREPLSDDVNPEAPSFDPYGAIAPLGSDQKQPISISPSELIALESSFEVYDEKSSSRLYRAFITYRFKPDAVRELLKKSTLPYSEAQTRTALVLPVLQTDRGVYLWEENNPWLAAWRSRPYTHELTPMIAPLGDLEDTTTVSAERALNLDAEAMAVLAERYGVSQVIVAHARLKQVDGADQVRVRLVNAFRAEAQAQASQALEEQAFAEDALLNEASNSRGDLFGLRSAPDEDFAAEVGEVIATTYGSEISGNFPIFAEKLIDSVIAKYASGWKERTLIDHATTALLSTTAFYDTLDHWGRIRAALVATPLVGSVQISALSPRGSEMEIRVFGEPERLQTALENQGIVFWTETGARWYLATPDVASRYRGQRFLRKERRSYLKTPEANGARGATRWTPSSVNESSSQDQFRRTPPSAYEE